VRAAHDEFAEAFGQDSFLDILTNVVGIIILLVLMVGLRAGHDARGVRGAQLQTADADKPALENELQEACTTAVTAERTVQDLVDKAVDVHGAAMFREKERAYLNTFVTGFEQEVESRRAKLSVQEQRDFDLRRRLAEAQQTLDNLTREQVALLSQPAPVEVIENEPTPLARPSTGKELSLKLAEGHVAVIPVDELLKEASKDMERNLYHLKNRNDFTGTVGPINNFRLRYRVTKQAISRPREQGLEEHGTMAIMDRFEFLPMSSPLGEPVDQALMPGSEVWQQLKSMSPDTTIVKMAVYPDSISECHRLKQAFSQAGYATAEYPMEQNSRLLGSPYGLKAYAQ
jgi:hypothetical protein